MSNQKMNSIFLCPASDYLNQFNETGSHGQISYQLLKHLAEMNSIDSLFAVSIASLAVEKIPKTIIDPLFPKNGKALNEIDSLAFYLISFLKYYFHSAYKKANIVHHVIPFSFGRSFNLFFLFKNKKKKYILGPIIGPHTDAAVVADETYTFNEEEKADKSISHLIYKSLINVLLFFFQNILFQMSLATMRNADIVLFSDNHALSNHHKYLHNKQKAYILDTGIDTDIFKPHQSTHSNLFRILFVGRLTKRKGCEYLIRAIHEVLEEKPEVRILCQIHGIGPLRSKLEDLVIQLNIQKYVQFLGGVKSNEEIVNRYHNTDIVCLPALSETFTVTKEALCCGKPVIVTDICSNAERIDEGIDGFVVPAGNSTSIARIILKLCSNKDLLKKMSEAAIKKRENYDWKIIVTKYLAILHNEKI